MMGNCRDCKWWHKRRVVGECERFNQPDMRLRSNARYPLAWMPSRWFTTRGEFGCKLFEAKEPQP